MGSLTLGNQRVHSCRQATPKVLLIPLQGHRQLSTSTAHVLLQQLSIVCIHLDEQSVLSVHAFSYWCPEIECEVR